MWQIQDRAPTTATEGLPPQKDAEGDSMCAQNEPVTKKKLRVFDPEQPGVIFNIEVDGDRITKWVKEDEQDKD
jgi:hypothetical protein